MLLLLKDKEAQLTLSDCLVSSAGGAATACTLSPSTRPFLPPSTVLLGRKATRPEKLACILLQRSFDFRNKIFGSVYNKIKPPLSDLSLVIQLIEQGGEPETDTSFARCNCLARRNSVDKVFSRSVIQGSKDNE